jgi:hypothetical protein
MARGVNELGFSPYVDFFMPHPPLLLLLAPFTSSVIALRIALLVVQLLILFFFERILRYYEVELDKIVYLLLLFVCSSAFINFYNQYLGFELTTLFCLISYYNFLKKRDGSAVFFASLATMTRLFALPYALFITFHSLRVRKYYYLLIFVPLLLGVVFVPSFWNNVFLYHALSKDTQHFLVRLGVIGIYWLMEGWLFAFSGVKESRRETVLACFIALFVSSTRIIISMYYSLVTPFLLLSLRGQSKKRLGYFLVWVALFLPYTVNPPESYFEGYCSPLNSIGLPLIGDTNLANLLNLYCGVPLVNRTYDTSVYRWREIGLFNESHVLTCTNDFTKVSLCNHVNMSNYDLLFRDEFFSFYKSI